MHPDIDLTAVGHFPGVPDESKASNIGRGMCPMLYHGLAGYIVQRPHGLRHTLQEFWRPFAALQRSCQDPRADGFSQHQQITWLSRGIGDDLVWMRYASH